MRNITFAERTRMQAPHVNHYLKVEVRDSDLTWRDLTNLNGVDWVDSVTWSEDIDQPCASGQVLLRREAPGSLSLAPLMQGSVINTNALTFYSPFVNPGRQIRVSTAVTLPGVAPISADWHVVFLGKIDAVDFSRGADSVVTVDMRDLGAFVIDTWIELPHIYGSIGGLAVEAEIQRILNDNLATIPTLSTPASPGWNILPYTQDRVNVMDAIRALALQIGWDVRYKFPATGDTPLLTFYLPRPLVLAVTQTSDAHDIVFAKDEYLEIPQALLSDADVRNVIRIYYGDQSLGTPQYVTSSDAVSITTFGRRYMELLEAASSNINTSPQAQKMADAIRDDLSTPIVQHEMQTLYFWPAQLGDYYTFSANGLQYDTDQSLAIVHIEHAFKDGEGRSNFKCRGKPAGAYREWLAGQRRRKVIGNVNLPTNIASATTTSTPAQQGFTLTTSAKDSTVLPAVELVALTGPASATLASGAAAGTFAASGSAWVFNRPTVGAGTATAQFRASLAGYQDTDIYLTIPEAGPALPFVSLTLDLNGVPTLTMNGPPTILSYKYYGTTSGFPSDASTVSTGSTLNANSGSVNPGPTLTPGQQLFYTVVAFSGAGATGVQYPGVQVIASYTLGPTPGIPQGTVSIDTDGNVEFNIDGPSWAQSFKYATSTSAFPSDVTAAAGTLVNARQFNVSLGGSPLTLGQTIYATFIPYSGTGATGNTGVSIRLRGSFQSFTATKTASYAASQFAPEYSGGPASYAYYGTDGSLRLTTTLAGLTQYDFDLFPVLPDGATITNIAHNLYWHTTIPSGGVNYTDWRISSGNTLTSLGSAAATNISWQTLNNALSESTTGRSYRCGVQFNNRASNGENAAGSIDITYTIASPKTGL